MHVIERSIWTTRLVMAALVIAAIAGTSLGHHLWDRYQQDCKEEARKERFRQIGEAMEFARVGRGLLDEKKFEQALENLRQAVALNPNRSRHSATSCSVPRCTRQRVRLAWFPQQTTMQLQFEGERCCAPASRSSGTALSADPSCGRPLQTPWWREAKNLRNAAVIAATAVGWIGTLMILVSMFMTWLDLRIVEYSLYGFFRAALEAPSGGPIAAVLPFAPLTVLYATFSGLALIARLLEFDDNVDPPPSYRGGWLIAGLIGLAVGGILYYRGEGVLGAGHTVYVQGSICLLLAGIVFGLWFPRKRESRFTSCGCRVRRRHTTSRTAPDRSTFSTRITARSCVPGKVPMLRRAPSR
jgi:hypothetical protein